jgi:hypothetical protein
MDGSRARVAFGSCAGLLVLLAPVVAEGYCRTRSCNHTDPAAADACQHDQACLDRGEPDECCVTSGVPIAWPESCVTFSAQKDGSRLRGISFDTFDRALESALYKWSHVDCGGGERPTIEIFDRSPVECAEVSYRRPGANIWMFRDADWPHAPTALALTTVSFGSVSGAIVDADVELNSHGFQITAGDAGVSNDLEAIVTHEAGHTLGLGESGVVGGTMYGYYRPADTSIRTLREDDIQGICAVYPRGRDARPCNPFSGFSSTCAARTHQGCALTGGVDHRSGSLVGCLALGGIALGRRRRRV